jgi:spoIIIJ-associated protein
VTNDQNANPRVDDDAVLNAADSVARFCRELIEGLHLTLEVAAQEQERVVTVNLSGPDRSILLSNTAAVLNSMEYLLNRVFQTGKDEEIATIILDSDHYRQHREAELKLLAQIASQKVITQHRPLSLQPMTPRERRIVHLALAEIQGVHSQSNGEGENRNITIYPAD